MKLKSITLQNLLYIFVSTKSSEYLFAPYLLCRYHPAPPFTLEGKGRGDRVALQILYAQFLSESAGGARNAAPERRRPLWPSTRKPPLRGGAAAADAGEPTGARHRGASSRKDGKRDDRAEGSPPSASATTAAPTAEAAKRHWSGG